MKIRTFISGMTASAFAVALTPVAFAAEFEMDTSQSGKPSRTGICSMVQAGGALNGDATLLEACGQKYAALAPSAPAKLYNAPVVSETQNIENLVSVMQQIRQQQSSGDTVIVPAADSVPFAVAASAPVTGYSTVSYSAQSEYELSSALKDIRTTLGQTAASPNNLWFVGVYR